MEEGASLLFEATSSNCFFFVEVFFVSGFLVDTAVFITNFEL